MSHNSNNQNIENTNGGQVVTVEQSGAVRVETLGTILPTGGLQEQIWPGDSQQVDTSEDMNEGGQEDDQSSSGSDESFTFEVRDKIDFYHTPETRALKLAERMIGGVHQSHGQSWHFEGRQGPLVESEQETQPLRALGQVTEGFAALHPVDTKRRPMEEVHEGPATLAELCGNAATSLDVAMPFWYLLEGKKGMQMRRPYDPVAGEVEAEETSYAVSASIPACPM